MSHALACKSSAADFFCMTATIVYPDVIVGVVKSIMHVCLPLNAPQGFGAGNFKALFKAIEDDMKVVTDNAKET